MGHDGDLMAARLTVDEMRDQIAKPPPFDASDFVTGFLRVARGMGRKLLIAEPLGAFTGKIFDGDPAGLSAGQAWLALACFTVQIYFDFSGYSDMAIGASFMLGIRLPANFFCLPARSVVGSQAPTIRLAVESLLRLY
jgi:alginate O-acetyltransferase complex protein AlgI